MAKEDLKITALQYAIAELDAENAELKAQLQNGVKTPSVKLQLIVPAEAFEVDGQRFQFVSPAFIFNGIAYTAVQALKDPELLGELVALEAGFLRKL